MLGYNCSEQASTKASPCSVMHAVEPIIPPAVKPRFLEYVDNPGLAAVSILQRSAALRRNITMAGGSLLIAQHYDTLRYARMRGGGTLRGLRWLNVRDDVYHRNNGAPHQFGHQGEP